MWYVIENKDEKKWKRIGDEFVCSVWRCECEDCPNDLAEFSLMPIYFVDGGTPYCEECDQPMTYLRTEIIVGEDK